MQSDSGKMKRQSENLAGQAREVKRVTWFGLITNVLLAAFKILAGFFGASQAVLADGVHSLSDTVTDAALLIGVRYWTIPPDREHPHGHRRIETLITAFIGIILAGVAVLIAYNAIVTIGDRHTRPPELLALVAALVSIALKEALYHWTKHVGRRAMSPALIANAWHHRSDGLSSIPVAIAVTMAMVYPRWYYLDHIGALLVSAFILYAALKIIWPTLMELTDSSAPPELVEQINRICLETDGVLASHKCRTRRLGHFIQVDLHIQVSAKISVHDGHEICEEVSRNLMKKVPLVTDVLTHLEPFEGSENSGESSLFHESNLEQS